MVIWVAYIDILFSAAMARGPPLQIEPPPLLPRLRKNSRPSTKLYTLKHGSFAQPTLIYLITVLWIINVVNPLCIYI